MAANERFPVKLFPTATASDVLFYVVVGRMDKRKIPEYGTPYNDITPRVEDWPHHRLVHISPPDSEGSQRWWFAADREEQDCYNWDIGQGVELTRTYLVRRDLYLQRSEAEAEADPKQEGEFTYPVVATLDTQFTKYGFADDSVLEAPDELKSLYVVVKRRFLRPVVSDINYDENLELRIKTTYTLVPATDTEADMPDDELGKVYELEPVNSFHSRLVSREVVPKEVEGAEPGDPPWTLADYVRTRGIRTNIPNLPRELLAVSVIWNSSYSVGTQDYFFAAWESGGSFSLGKSASDQASSSAAITPELQLKYRDVEASNLPATEYELMIPGDATEAAVIARLNAILTPATVQAWPVFRPESVTLSTTGQSIKVSCDVGVSLSGTVKENALTGQSVDRSSSDGYSVQLSNSSVQLPPCVHDQITLSGGTSQSQLVAASAFMQMSNSLVGSISSSLTKSGTAYGVVSPSVIPAISGTHKTIPTSGLYALDIRPGRSFLGATLVTATVLNAATLA